MQNLYDEQNDIVHAPGWAGHDYSLCGSAMEGEVKEASEMVETNKKITCETCIAIIRHCKSIRLPTLHAPDAAKSVAEIE